jgi:succinate dehydrogenase / fumarate reductase flavoprotein subunit
MEFFQFHPTGLRGLGILVSEAVRGEGGVLRNRSGEPFMERYSPKLLDLAPRDIVSRAIVTEIREGRGFAGDGTAEDYVVLDATALGAETLRSKLPDITGFCRTYLGLDPAETPIPVLPTAHYAMGGIPTDDLGRVAGWSPGEFYHGLYAAGECACVSVHGANRLGTNSLVDLVVFGRRAGDHMAGYATGSGGRSLPDGGPELAREWAARLRPGRGGSGTAAEDLRWRMETVMMEKVGIFRRGLPLAEAVQELSALRGLWRDLRPSDASRAFNVERLDLLELGNLLDLAYVTAASSLARLESRGSHAREDHPDRDDARWLRHTLARLDGDRVEIGDRPVDLGRWAPAPRAY